MINRPFLFLMTLALPAAACALPEEPAFDDGATRGLINGSPTGTEIPDLSPNLVNIPGCSATLLTGRWVITAAQCWGAGQLSVTRGTTTIVTDQKFQMPGVDFALGHLKSPFPGTAPLLLWPGQASSLEGKTVHVFGRGGTGGAYNQGKLPVKTTNQPNGYVLDPGPNGERLTNGDAGGPGLVGEPGVFFPWLTGVSSATAPGAGTQVSTPHFRKFVDQSLFGPASDRGGGLATAIALAEVAPGFLNAFAVGNDGNFYFQAKDLGAGTWGNWQFAFGPPPGGATSDPAAVSGDQTYLFVKGGDQAIWVKIRNSSGQWTAWQSIGGVGTSGPGVAITNTNSGGEAIVVYVRGQDGNIYRQFGDVPRGSGTPLWEGWLSHLGRPPAGSSTSAPAAVLINNHDILSWVFIRGADNRVYSKRFLVGVGWTDWESLGGNTSFGVAAVSYRPHRVDVFAVGGDTKLWHRVFEGRWWTETNNENESWIQAPTSLPSNARPAAIAPRLPEIEIAVRGSLGNMWVQTYAF